MILSYSFSSLDDYFDMEEAIGIWYSPLFSLISMEARCQSATAIDMLVSNYDINPRSVTSCMYHETGSSEIELQQLFDVKSLSSC